MGMCLHVLDKPRHSNREISQSREGCVCKYSKGGAVTQAEFCVCVCVRERESKGREKRKCEVGCMCICAYMPTWSYMFLEEEAGLLRPMGTRRHLYEGEKWKQ